MMLHARIRKKVLIEKLNHLGISVSYGRVMELTTRVGNAVLSKYAVEGIVCPPSLKPNVFTTDAIDNIDHNPSSTTAEGSFHGTGISLFQRQIQKKLEYRVIQGYQMSIVGRVQIRAELGPNDNYGLL